MHSLLTPTVYNPWPHFVFSGKLRPAPLSSQRDVPEQIPRPDYVSHPEGVSLEEKSSRIANQIVV